MAKIYETQQDFERDMLAEQATGLREKAHKHDGTGWALMLGSVLVDLWNTTRRYSSRAMSFASGVLAVAGIIEWIQGWRTHSRAHDLDLQRERLGPGMIVLPPPEGQALAQDEECQACKLKSHRHARLRKTPLDFAEKQPDDPNCNVNR